MASFLSSIFILLLTLLFYFSADAKDISCYSSKHSNASTSEKFLSSIKSSTNQIRYVSSLVSGHVNKSQDFRLANAVKDCTELLALTADELSWVAKFVTNDANGSHLSTGNKDSDLKAWLSATIGNQETCLEGLRATRIKSIKETLTTLKQLKSLLQNVLGMLCPHHPTPSSSSSLKPSLLRGRGRRKLTSGHNDIGKYPPWIKRIDRRLLQSSIDETPANAVVAADGSGTHKTVTEAVLSAPDNSKQRYVIRVKSGVYKENVEINRKKWNLMIIGDGMNSTIISGNRSFVDGWTTYRSATFVVVGGGFIAKDITFENTAGPEKHQAVALRSNSDLSVFYRCGIHGYQDTLYAHSLRQFYRECHISGTIDFIFGNSAAVFQKCEILAKKGLPEQKNTITAHGRSNKNQTTGFSIQFSNISADSDLLASQNWTETYLGRPWGQYSRTVFVKSYISDMIRPQGWLPWKGNFALDTLYYGEYLNYGPGADLKTRVSWPGYHQIQNSTEASYFTVASFLDGNYWLPSTGVTYTAGLTP